MKFKSENAINISKTEHLENNNGSANNQIQNLSGEYSNTMEGATRPNQNNSLGGAMVDKVSDENQL